MIRKIKSPRAAFAAPNETNPAFRRCSVEGGGTG